MASRDAPEALDAGPFASWLDGTRAMLAREHGADVPCGTCTACCRSAQFVHIAPEEKRTLARIPPQLLFPAPGLPKGNLLLGYDEHGRCPMLIDDRCSIYADRPSACRNYDCRVFAAAGIKAGDGDHPVARQVERWRFRFPAHRDDEAYRAVEAAAAFLEQHADLFPPGFLPRNPSQLAVLALKVFTVFIGRPAGSLDAAGNRALVDAIAAAHEQFQTTSDNERRTREHHQ
jgi:uncharacterized protein